jgi:hypothetical protein
MWPSISLVDMEQSRPSTKTTQCKEELVYGETRSIMALFLLLEKLHVTTLELRRKGLGRKVVSLLLEKAKKFLQHERPDGEDADLIYGSDEAFERAWTSRSSQSWVSNS